MPISTKKLSVKRALSSAPSRRKARSNAATWSGGLMTPASRAARFGGICSPCRMRSTTATALGSPRSAAPFTRPSK
jgi:hypothetical protein